MVQDIDRLQIPGQSAHSSDQNGDHMFCTKNSGHHSSSRAVKDHLKPVTEQTVGGHHGGKLQLTCNLVYYEPKRLIMSGVTLQFKTYG
jgi:hypothetical protein